MPSLVKVLSEAESHNASEITIAPGEPATLRTSSGSQTLGDAMSERELFDALSQVLAPEQQAELAVGSVVEFHLEVGGQRWTMLTEPGRQGLVVRGRVQNGSGGGEMGSPLELPPLEPFDPAGSKTAPPAKRNRTTQWDLALQDLGSEGEASEPEPEPEPEDWLVSNAQEGKATGGSPPQAAEADFDVRPSKTKLERVSHQSSSSGVRGRTIGVEDIGAPPPNPPQTAPPSAELPLATMSSAFEDDEHDGGLARVAGAVGEGTLCVVQAEGAGATLARFVAGGSCRAIESADLAELRRAAQEVPGTTFVVQLEDPSQALGWILRRLEEGSRVIVETRARTLEGARRILLGLHAADRAEQWLQAHPFCWVARRDGQWSHETL